MRKLDNLITEISKLNDVNPVYNEIIDKLTDISEDIEELEDEKEAFEDELDGANDRIEELEGDLFVMELQTVNTIDNISLDYTMMIEVLNETLKKYSCNQISEYLENISKFPMIAEMKTISELEETIDELKYDIEDLQEQLDEYGLL